MNDAFEIDTRLGESLQPHEHALAQRMAAIIARGVCQPVARSGAPARRDVHTRAHGCVHARVSVEAVLPGHLATGVFVPGAEYDAWIRFSNGDADERRSDARGDVHAMAIKLVGKVEQDFILLDSPIFLASDARAYVAFIERQASWNPLVRLGAPLALGLRGAWIGWKMRSARIANPLTTRYWSTVPFRHGDPPHAAAVKFSAAPRAPAAALPARPGPRYLREAMIASLRYGDAAFDFLVQPRTSPALSVEDSRSEWPEAQAPFYKVATITIPQQEFATAERDALAESLAFDPWHALPQHRPLGSVNRARRIVYATIADLRRRFGDPR